MNRPETADKILTAILNEEGNTPQEIAGHLKMDRRIVEAVLEELKSDHKTWFQETKGERDDDCRVIIKPGYEYIVKAFLQNEGFAGLENRRMEDIASQKKADDSKETSSTVTNMHAAKAMADAEEAVRLAKQAQAIAERSKQAAERSLVIANEATEIARKAKRGVLWVAVMAVIVFLILIWCLTR